MNELIKSEAEKYAEGSYNHERELMRKEAFTAGAEFMQKELEAVLERYKVIVEEIKQSENYALKKKLKVAVEALEFYGNKENWQAPEDQGFEHHDSLDNTLADMIHEDHDKKTGGKRAREALEKIKAKK